MWIKSHWRLDQVAPVFFRVKIACNGDMSFYGRTLRFTRGHCWKLQTWLVGLAFQSSQGSHPASRVLSRVSLLRRSSAGVVWMWMVSLNNGSLGCWPCQPLCLLLFDGVEVLPCTTLLQTSPASLSGMSLGIEQNKSETSSSYTGAARHNIVLIVFHCCGHRWIGVGRQ